MRTRSYSLPSRCLAGLLSGLIAQTLVPGVAFAGPRGEHVAHGQASFSRDGGVTSIVASDRAIIDYRSFDILQNEAVQFVQPDATARVLNRIRGADPTHIDGSLTANGRVYIVNPSGVYFGGQAVVDVAGLYAAAGAISQEDFLARRDRFTSLHGEVVNLGSIRGEIVALLGGSVANHGSIVSPGGLIALVAGNEAVLVPIGDRVRVRVAGAAPAALGSTPGVENTGRLDAGDGGVSLAAGDLYSLAISQTESGSISGGDIEVAGGAGSTLRLSGGLDATDAASGATGGSITLTGERVALVGAALDASGDAGGGSIRVGGDFHGGGEVPTAQRTYVSADSELRADALTNGKGGSAVVWADQVTGFYGHASARGGAQGGDGGAIEISGKQGLVLAGTVDTRAPAGHTGSLLIDPTNVNVIDGPGGAEDAQLDADQPNGGDPEGEILAADGGAVDFKISEERLEALSADTNVNLEATNDITVADLSDDVLGLQTDAGNSVTFTADADASGAGAFSMNAGDTIQTAGADLTISGAGLSLGALSTGAGAIALDSGAGAATLGGSVSGGSLTVAGASAQVNANVTTTGNQSFQSDATTLGGSGSRTLASSAGNIELGDAGTDTLAVNVATTASAPAGAVDLNAATSLAANLSLGGATLTVDGTVDDDGSAPTSSSLGLNGSTSASIDAPIGGTTPITSLDATGAGSLDINDPVAAAVIDVNVADGVNVATTLTGTTSVSLHSGNDGSGDLDFAAASEVRTPSATLIAGDGPTASGTPAAITNLANLTLRGAAGGATSPGTLVLAQDADLATGDLAFGGALPANVSLTSHEGSLTVDAAIDTDGSGASSLSLAAADDLAIDADITDSATGSVDVLTFSAHAGTDGSGKITFGAPGSQVWAQSSSLRAGDGTATAAAPNTTLVDLTNATLLGTGGTAAPMSLVLRQDESVADAVDPTVFGNAPAAVNPSLPTNYTLQSDEGTVTVASADRVNTTPGVNLIVSGETGVVLADGLDLATLTASAPGAGAGITLNGDVTTSGAQTYNQAVALAGPTNTLTGTNVSFASTVNGASALAVNASGTTTFDGAVGVTSVSTDDAGSLAINANVTTTGNQSYADDMITIGGTGPRTLSSTAGDIALGDEATDALTVNVATTASATAGLVDLNAATTLNNNLTLTGTTVNVDGTVNEGGAATSSSLVLNGSGATTIAAAIGGSAALDSVTSNDAGSLAINANVSTSGNQSYADDTITIGGAGPRTLSSSAGGISLGDEASDALTVNVATTASATAGLVDLNAATTLNNDLALTGTTVNVDGTVNEGGAATSSNLVLSGSGATTIAVAIGGSAALDSVTSNDAGSLALNANVTTTGNQSYADDTITIGGAGPRTLSSTAGGITLGDEGTDALTVNVATTASATAGVVDLNAATALNTDLTLTGATVNVDGTVNEGGAVTSSNLVLNGSGATTVSAAIGGSAALDSVTSNDAGSLALNANVTTTGNQSYADDTITVGGAGPRTLSSTAGGITLGDEATDTLTVNVATTASATAGLVDLNAATTLNNDLTLTGTTVNVDGTVNEGGAATSSNLALNGSGATTVAAAITGIDSVTTNAAGTTALNANVSTSGAQTYNDAVTLGGPTTTLAGTNVNFANTLSGASNLTINASGTTTFGDVTSLTSIITDAAGTTAINGPGMVTTTGDQTYHDAVTLGNATTLLTGANVNLASSVNGASALTVNTSGTTTLGGVVGGTTALTSVTTDAPGTTAINGGAVTATNQTYNDAVTLGSASTTLTGTNVTVANTVNGASALAVNASGTTTFGGAVGGTTALTSVSTNDAGTLALNGNVSTTGNQSYADDTIAIGGAGLRTLSATTGGVTLGDEASDALTVNVATTASAPAGLVDLNAATTLNNDLSLVGSTVNLDGAVNEGAAPTSSDLSVAGGSILVSANLGAATALDSINLDVTGTDPIQNVIEFASGATTVRASGALSLNADGRAAAPLNATIFKRSGNLALNGATVTFGARDKVTVVGNLAITGTGAVSVPDLNALGLTIDAGTLTVIPRGGAPTVNGNGDDLGADFVANSIVINAGSFSGASQSPVKAGVPNAGGSGELVINGSTTPSGPFVPVAVFSNTSKAVAAADFVATVSGQPNVVVDLEAGGPARGSQRPPPNPLAILIAKPSGGVNAAATSEKPLRESEVSAFLECDPEDFQCQEKAVGAARARSAEAQDLRASYAKLFGVSGPAAATQATPAEPVGPKAALKRAVDAYRAQTGQDPTGVAFRQFCESAPQHADALQVLDNLRNLFRGARALGQTGEGLGNFKQQQLNQVTPEGISYEALDAAIEAGGLSAPTESAPTGSAPSGG